MSVFRRRIKGMKRLRPEQMWTGSVTVTRNHRPLLYESAASCKDIARPPLTNWEPHCLKLAGYCYTVRQGMKVQLVTPYHVIHLQRYEVTLQVWTRLKALG
jgi:hypothetical protein